MKTSGNTILMTGGGTGIGRALAHRLHDLGNQVIVTGRREDALAESIKGRDGMSALRLDVADAADIDRFAKDVIAKYPALNVLINNAGVMIYEKSAEKRDLKPAETMIETNILGPIRLTDALIEHLKKQKDAAILNVTSGLAFVPLAPGATYSATKAFLHSYTVSLRALLKDQVEVIEIAPPGVQTDLTPGQATREGYMKLDDYADETIALLTQAPTPPEILVEQVKPLRNAEKEGRFDQIVAMLASR